MQNQKTEILILPDGKIIQRSIIETEKNIGHDVIERFSSGVVRSFPNVFSVEGRPVEAFIEEGENGYFSTRVTKIPLKAPFKIEEGILYPKFSATNEPVFPMEWITPDEMWLQLIVKCYTRERKTFIHTIWLIALDKENRAYRLPLANLFEDGRICIGDILNERVSAQDAVSAVWEQIKNSVWNGDLDMNPDEAKSMFRFKALADGFEQLPPLSHWKELCRVIAPPILKIIGI